MRKAAEAVCRATEWSGRPMRNAEAVGMKAEERLWEAFGTRAYFTADDAMRLLGRTTPGYLRLLIFNLRKKGRLFSIGRGTYSFHSDAAVAGFGFRPFYYGLQDALSIHGIWEQETIPVILTARQVRSGRREFAGGPILVRRIARPMFFGFEMVKYSGVWVPVSTPEKTLIDLVHFRQPIGREVRVELKKKMDKKRLERYLRICRPILRKKVLNLLGWGKA